MFAWPSFLTHHFLTKIFRPLHTILNNLKLPFWHDWSTFQTWWKDHPKLCSPGPLQAEPQQHQTSAWRGRYQYMGGRSHSRGRTQHCNFQRNHFLSFPRRLIKHFHLLQVDDFALYRFFTQRYGSIRCAKVDNTLFLIISIICFMRSVNQHLYAMD